MPASVVSDDAETATIGTPASRPSGTAPKESAQDANYLPSVLLQQREFQARRWRYKVLGEGVDDEQYGSAPPRPRYWRRTLRAVDINGAGAAGLGWGSRRTRQQD